MNDIERQLKQIEELGVLEWNIVEDITNAQEQNYENDEKKSILEEIFPPREWTNTNDGLGTRTWRQTISRELPTRNNLSNMIQTFEDCERVLKLKNQGICESTNALYNLFFDELLRQIIIEDGEVGKIIYRIHKEFKNVIFTLKYMVEKSVGFDLYNSVTEDPEVQDLIMKKKDLTTKCEKASRKYSDTLRQKELNENVKYLAWLEDCHRKRLFDITQSTEQLQEQFDIASEPVTFAPVTQHKEKSK